MVWPPVEPLSMRSPRDCELLLDELLPELVIVPPVVLEVVWLFVVLPAMVLLELEPLDALLLVIDELSDMDEPELVLFMLEEPDAAFPVAELPLFIELLLDVLLAAKELALVPELLEPPTIV